MTKAQRRKVIAKRVGAAKISATWKKKRQETQPKALPSSDEFGGLPETDTLLDELPESLVG